VNEGSQRPAANHVGGRQDAFTSAFKEHYGALMAYGLRRAPKPDAEDIVSEAFAVAWRRWDDAPQEYVRPWLFSIARNLLANHYRGLKRRQRMLLRVRTWRTDHTVPSPETYGLAQGERDELREALLRLSAEDREVLLLAAWEQLDHSEIARVLGCEPGTARVRLHRARKRLKGHLEEQEERSTETGDQKDE
jgi:RNA polymerase sigma factor (sigma-70 family)